MSASWLLTLLALVLTGAGTRVVVQQRVQTGRTTAEIRRLRSIVAENARLEAAIAALDETANQVLLRGTAGIEITTGIVQSTHHAIASIPFGVLESIPATAPVTKVVHEIHDQIADGVYGAISGVSRAIRRAPRRRPPPERPRYDADPEPTD